MSLKPDARFQRSDWTKPGAWEPITTVHHPETGLDEVVWCYVCVSPSVSASSAARTLFTDMYISSSGS